jgi:hypothetical protein
MRVSVVRSRREMGWYVEFKLSKMSLYIDPRSMYHGSILSIFLSLFHYTRVNQISYIYTRAKSWNTGCSLLANTVY